MNAKTIKTADALAAQAARFAYLAGANQVFVVDLINARHAACANAGNVANDRDWWHYAALCAARSAAREARLGNVQNACADAIDAAKYAEYARAA